MDAIQKWTLITSIVGAAAWIPTLLSIIKNWLMRPVVTVTPSHQCQVGFTELGPILNINLAITADNQNVLIDCIHLEVTHDSRATYKFRWHEVEERTGQLIVPGVGSQPIFQESEAIAIKILPTDFKTLLLKCRLEEHTQGLRKHDYDFNKERRRLVNNGIYNYTNFYASSTVQNMEAFLKSQMIWRKGSYVVEFLIHARDEVRINAPRLVFELTDDDIQLLHANCDNLPRLLKNACMGGVPNAEPITAFEWHFLSKQLSKL